MNTKALRQKILDLAIHGKLVPQDPNDEPASVLLERIRDEKERLINEGKIKRPKKAKATSDKPHYPYELPEGWVWTTIEELFFVTKLAGFEYTDCLTKDSISRNNEVPIVRAQNVRMGSFVENANEAISEALSLQLERSALIKKCLLMTFIGAGIGDTCIFPALKRCHLAPNVAKIEPYSNEIDLKYALYYLMSDLGQLGVRGISKSTAQPSLSMATIRSMDLALPPLAEQYHIVAEIEKWFALIDQIEQSKADLQTAIKQAKSKILDLAIHGKLVPQNPNDEPALELLKRINPEFTSCDNGHYQKLPEGWCLCLLNDVLKEVFAGGDKPLIFSKNKSEENYIPIYANGTENKGLFGFTNKAQVYERCLTISARGTIGFTCIREVPFVPIVRLITAIPLPVINLLFLKHQIDTMLSYTEGSSIPQLTIPTIKRMPIILPPLKEQLRIVAKIEELFALLDTIKAQL